MIDDEKNNQTLDDEVQMEVVTSVYDEIINLLASSGMVYAVLEHEPVYTMQQAAEVCKHKPEQGVKVLVVKCYTTKKQHYPALVVWTGDQAVDFDQLAKAKEVRRVKLTSPTEVRELLGIDIGALAPFGYSTSLPVFIHGQLLSQDELFINAGQHDKTISLSADDLLAQITAWSEEVTKI